MQFKWSSGGWVIKEKVVKLESFTDIAINDSKEKSLVNVGRRESYANSCLVFYLDLHGQNFSRQTSHRQTLPVLPFSTLTCHGPTFQNMRPSPSFFHTTDVSSFHLHASLYIASIFKTCSTPFLTQHTQASNHSKLSAQRTLTDEVDHHLHHNHYSLSIKRASTSV